MTIQYTEQEAFQKFSKLVAEAVRTIPGVEELANTGLAGTTGAIKRAGYVTMRLTKIGRPGRGQQYRVVIDGGRTAFTRDLRRVNMGFKNALEEFKTRCESTDQALAREEQIKAETQDLKQSVVDALAAKGLTQVDYDFHLKANTFSLDGPATSYKAFAFVQNEQYRYHLGFMFVEGQLIVFSSKKVWVHRDYPLATDILNEIL